MSITQLNIMSDVTNELFSRREVNILLRDSYGKLSRTEAKQIIAANLKVDENSIFIIDISGHSGNDDANVLFHVYNNVSDGNRYLPKYILKRNSVVTKESELSNGSAKESDGSDSESKKIKEDSKESDGSDSESKKIKEDSKES